MTIPGYPPYGHNLSARRHFTIRPQGPAAQRRVWPEFDKICVGVSLSHNASEFLRCALLETTDRPNFFKALVECVRNEFLAHCRIPNEPSAPQSTARIGAMLGFLASADGSEVADDVHDTVLRGWVILTDGPNAQHHALQQTWKNISAAYAVRAGVNVSRLERDTFSAPQWLHELTRDLQESAARHAEPKCATIAPAIHDATAMALALCEVSAQYAVPPGWSELLTMLNEAQTRDA